MGLSERIRHETETKRLARLAQLEREAAAWREVCRKVDLCMQNDVTGYAVVELVKEFRSQFEKETGTTGGATEG